MLNVFRILHFSYLHIETEQFSMMIFGLLCLTPESYNSDAATGYSKARQLF